MGLFNGRGRHGHGFGIDSTNQRITLTGFTAKPGEYPIIEIAFSPDSLYAYIVDGTFVNSLGLPPNSKIHRHRINQYDGSLVSVDSVPLNTAVFISKVVIAPNGNHLYVTDRKGVIQIFPINGDGSLGYANVENVVEAANVLFHPTLPVAYVATAVLHNVSSTSLLNLSIIDNVYLNLVPFSTPLSVNDIGISASIVDPSGKSVFFIGGSINSALNQAFVQQQDGSLFNLTSIPLTGTQARSVVSLQLPK